LTAEARRSFLDACGAIERAGARLVDVEIPDLEPSEGLLSTIVAPESTVAHSRWLRERPQGYAPRTRHQLEFGYAVPAVKYLRAQQYRRHLAGRFRAALDGLDALLSPTVAWAAPDEDPSIMSSAGQAEGRRTTPYNMIGFPALSVPSGFDGDGLPLGLQIATLPYTDWKTLAIGAAFDDLGLVRHRRPSLVESPAPAP
jgi:aspartyl-tRNA(Asn)/glutamyl-tRNA(Gln) amidotransferase subunit A